MYPSVRAQLKRRRVSQHSPLPPRLTLCHFDLPNLLFQHPVLTQSFRLPLLSFYLAQPQSLIQWLPLVFTSFVASLSVFSSASIYTAEEKRLGTLRVQVQHNNRMWSVCVCVWTCVSACFYMYDYMLGVCKVVVSGGETWRFSLMGFFTWVVLIRTSLKSEDVALGCSFNTLTAASQSTGREM